MTTQKQQPTPYDADIAKEEENRGSVGYLEYLRGARMGHLLAKAEDADLLAAAEAAEQIAALAEFPSDEWLAAGRRMAGLGSTLRAAIAKANGVA